MWKKANSIFGVTELGESVCVILVWTNKDLHFPRILYGLWSRCLLRSNSITLLELKRKNKTKEKENNHPILFYFY